MTGQTIAAAWLSLLLVSCHAGEPRGIQDGDPIVGSWVVLNHNPSGPVTFHESGTYTDPKGALFATPYGWRRESPDHISILERFSPVLDVRAVVTDDRLHLSLVWDMGSANLARLGATDGGELVLPGGSSGGATGKGGSSP